MAKNRPVFKFLGNFVKGVSGRDASGTVGGVAGDLVKQFLGQAIKDAPKIEALQASDGATVAVNYVDAVLALYDQHIAPIEIQQIPNSIEPLVDALMRDVVRRSLEAFLARRRAGKE